jgi:hypothetical protein
VSVCRLGIAFVLFGGAALAQDERRVTSPNGQIEFRLFIATQTDSNLSRLAYEVFYQGKPLLKTSFMGLDIEAQEPLLGENVGLTSSSSSKSTQYNSLIAKYMQNGSLGRLIDVEVRAYNDGVAFRYVIPPSTPLMEMVIAGEATEFRFAQSIPHQSEPNELLDYVLDDAIGFVPFTPDDPVIYDLIPLAVAWVAITESKTPSHPPSHLIRSNPTTDLTRLDHPFHATAPLTFPWRIVSIGAAPAQAIKSAIVAALNR